VDAPDNEHTMKIYRLSNVVYFAGRQHLYVDSRLSLNARYFPSPEIAALNTGLSLVFLVSCCSSISGFGKSRVRNFDKSMKRSCSTAMGRRNRGWLVEIHD
jgi:hypothetical protein